MDWGSHTNDQIDEAIAHFSGLASAGLANVCRLIQVVDERQSWMTDGARNLVDWVSIHLRVRHETARQLVDVARRLVDLPELSARFADGTLSIDQVESISKIATPDTEDDAIAEALGMTNAQLDHAARRANPPSGADERSVHERRALYLQWNLDESELKGGLRLPGPEGKVFQEAVEGAADQIPENPETGTFDPYPQRLADGLVHMVGTTSTGPATAPTPVTVFADLDALTTDVRGVAELGGGVLIPNETARMLCCDAVVETVISNENVTVGIGRRNRAIPAWLRRLVVYRDEGRCQFPGCRNTHWLQIHHIEHWALGGKTDLDNLILLCGYHHRFIHQKGWHITGNPNDGVTFRKPDWTPYPRARPDLHPKLRELVRST